MSDAPSNSSPPPRRIVLSNSYGTQNIGDEAILTVLIDQLRSHGFEVDVLTLTPGVTAQRHETARAIRSGVLRGSLVTFGAIRQAAALVVGGGGILQDATSFGNLLLHVSRPIMAWMTRTPVAIAGVGVGPLNRSLSRTLTRWACNAAASVDVRDHFSAQLLADMGVPVDRVQQSADFAHLLSSHNPEQMDDVGRALIDTLHKTREMGRRLVGLSLRPAVGDASRRSAMSAADHSHLVLMAQVADSIIERYDAQIVFVSMHAQQDDPIGSLLVKEMRHRERISMVSGKLPPATIKAAIAELDLLIGTRLHTLIFAACHGVPLIGLAYDDKVTAYLESLDLETQSLDPEAWHTDSILQLVDHSLESAEAIRGHLQRAVPRLQSQAAASIDRICFAARDKC